jgi:hypothetical protein
MNSRVATTGAPAALACFLLTGHRQADVGGLSVAPAMAAVRPLIEE